jgi:hypothetical protein
MINKAVSHSLVQPRTRGGNELTNTSAAIGTYVALTGIMIIFSCPDSCLDPISNYISQIGEAIILIPKCQQIKLRLKLYGL